MINRVDQGAEAAEPVELAARAVRAAVADTEAADPAAVLARIQSVQVPRIFSWPYRDPGRLIADRAGARQCRHSVYTGPGGHFPQLLVSRACDAIRRGDFDMVVVTGAESWRTRQRARAEQLELPWTSQAAGIGPAESLGSRLILATDFEASRGLAVPLAAYPIFESALRARSGSGHAEWSGWLGRFWSGFAEVARDNEYAWDRSGADADRIARPSPANRMVAFPYTKLMTANPNVEQAAAVIVCADETARELGIPPQRWVYPLAAAHAADPEFTSERQDLHSSPAIRGAAAAAFSVAGVTASDIDHADLYSCFPSAVQVAAAEVGLALDRVLTVTGGLAFAGGPWNNYATHAMATMVHRLRAEPGTTGLVTANGGLLTKHAVCVYRGSRPADQFVTMDAQPRADGSTMRRSAAPDHVGHVTVEGYTVSHDRAGTAAEAVLALLTGEGRRTWGRILSPESLAVAEGEELVGQSAYLTSDGTVTL